MGGWQRYRRAERGAFLRGFLGGGKAEGALREEAQVWPQNFFSLFWFSFLFVIFIGITHKEISGLLPPNKFFFAKDGRILNAAGALSGFGLPWNKLGTILSRRLCRFKVFGLNNVFSFFFIILSCFSVCFGWEG